jgi:hypothetical protein
MQAEPAIVSTPVAPPAQAVASPDMPSALER